MPIKGTFSTTSFRAVILMYPSRMTLRDFRTSAAVLFRRFGHQLFQDKVDAYGITNLRVGIGGEGWRVTAFARNLFDEEYVGEVIMAPEFGGAFVTPGTYRTAGVESSGTSKPEP